MTFAKHISCEFYDYFHNKWTVEIHDQSGATPIVFTGGAEPLSIRFGPDGDLESAIKDTECIVNLVEKIDEDYSWLLTDDDRKIKVIVKLGIVESESATSSDNVAIGTGTKFFTVETGLVVTVGHNIVVTHDGSNYMAGTVGYYEPLTGTLIVFVTYATGSGWHNSWTMDFATVTPTTFYTGWLLTNQFVDTLTYISQISVTFSDQLRLITSRPFLDGSVGPMGPATLLEQIIRALEETGLALNLNCACNLFQETMDQTDADDPFDQATLNQDIWLDAELNPGMCGDVLEKILQAMQCRIFQVDGEWWICRTKELVNDNIDYRKFNSAGVYVSNAVLNPKILTKPYGVRNPNFMVFGGELSFIPEWQFRNLEIDYGLKQSLIGGLVVDNNWIDDVIHRYWSNEGDVWHYWTNQFYGFLKADTDGRLAKDPTKIIHSPAVNIFAVNTYTLKVLCGRNHTPILGVVKNLLYITLHDPTDTYPDKCYNDRVYYNPDNPLYTEVKGIWEDISIEFGASNVDGIDFPVIPTENPGKDLTERSIPITAPPYDGEITFTFIAPWKSAGLSDDTLFYLGNVTFSRTAESDTLPNGEVSGIVINQNAVTIPDPLRLVINGGGVVRAEGAINTDRYLGILSVDGSEADLWIEKGSSEGRQLKDWILDGWYSQHKTISRLYEGNFLGLAKMYSVIQIGEFNDILFIWNDVEYSVKASLWTGSTLELKEEAVSIPASVLKSRVLPGVSGDIGTTGTGGLPTVPGGSDGQLQFKTGADFDGTTDITFDGTRILKGGTKPLIEYHAGTASVAAGPQTVTFDEPFLAGDDYAMIPIWGLDADGNKMDIIPYNKTITGFDVDCYVAVTFDYVAIIKR